MFKITIATLAVIACCAAVEADQRGWVMPMKTSGFASLAITRPQASIGGPSNGLYCTSPTENGVTVSDLGSLPAGLHVQITIQSLTTTNGFNPVAAVVVARMGAKAGNTIQTSTFYDDDSGGVQDPRLDFVTPFGGNYLLLVNDNTDATIGCYRYQMVIL